MAAEGTSIATAYVSLVPSMQGMQQRITSEVNGTVTRALEKEGAKAGTAAGKVAGSNMAYELGASLRRGFTQVGIVAAAVTGVAFMVKQFTDAAEAAQAADRRLQQVAESAGVTGGQYTFATARLKDYAAEVSRSIGVEDESVKAVQTKLLTFQSLAATADVAGGALDRATKAAFDLAATGFGEAESNAKLLGRALEDPVAALSALSRAGVQFTDAEKQRIQTLVATNRMSEAQAIILDKIEGKVGGVAEASLTASQKMARAWGEVEESIGSVALPIVDVLVPVFEYLERTVGETVKAFDDFKQEFAGLTGGLSSGVDVSKAFGDALYNLPSGLNVLREAVKSLAEWTEKANKAIFDLQRLLRPDSIVTPKATYKESAEGAEEVATGLQKLIDGTDGATDAAARGTTGWGSFFAALQDGANGAIAGAVQGAEDLVAAVEEANAILADMADIRFETTLRGLDEVTAAAERLKREQEQLAELTPGTLDYLEQQREVLRAQVALDDARYDQAQDAVDQQRQAREAAAEEARRAVEEMRQQARDMAEAVRDSAIGDIGVFGASAAGIAEGLRIRLQQIRDFARNLGTLADRGLPQWLIQDILDAGIPDGAQMAATLATASDVDFTKVARAARKAYAAAGVLGNQQAQRAYGWAPGATSMPGGAPTVNVVVELDGQVIDSRARVQVDRADAQRRQRDRAGRRYAS